MASRAAPQSRTPMPAVGSRSGSNDGDDALGPPLPSSSPPPAYTLLSGPDSTPLNDPVFTPSNDVIVVGDPTESSSSSITTASTVTVNNPPPAIPPPYPSQRQAWNNLRTESCGEGEHQFRKYPTGNAFIYAVVFFPFGLFWLCFNRKDICKRCGCYQGDSIALQDITSPHPRNLVNHTAS